MKNVELDVQGEKLVITVDLGDDFGPSKSGKSVVIASTEGNVRVEDAPDDGTMIGLNVYRKAKA